MQTFLTVASHWNVPGIRQYATQDRAVAERKAAELVEELRAEWEKGDAEHDRDAHAPPPIQGSDWESTLRALQLVRLIDYVGGEGDANDALYGFCRRHCRDEPPLIGDGFTPALQDIIRDFAEEEDADPDGIGFPMVWIETVEEIPVENLHGTGPDIDLVLRMAERFAAEGAIVDAEHRQPGDPTPDDVLAAIHRIRTGQPKAITVAASVSGGVLQWAGADAPGVEFIVIDYDQEGVAEGELVDMAQTDDIRSEFAAVYFENVEVNAEAIDRIKDKCAERELRESRYTNKQCLDCGIDLDAPSAAGAEEGICGSCLNGDE